MVTLKVEKLKSDQKLTSYIKNCFPSIIISKLYIALRKKDIRVNNIKVNSDVMVKNDDIITLYIKDEFLYNLPTDIKIVYEDNNILVALKPQGLLTNNEKDFEPSLDSILNKEDKLTLCHRLDRNTAGLVIFTKNQIATGEMLNAFKEGYIGKNYLAYVFGSNFRKKSDTLIRYIVYDKQNQFSKIVSKNEKGAIKTVTEYDIIKLFKDKNCALLNVKIHTGKMHQIRCVLSSISHPVIGDTKYGKNEINKKFNISKQLLIAYKYDFNFPENYILKYLNNIVLKLDNDLINRSIGSDIIGR